jgi:hypothetical protein
MKKIKYGLLTSLLASIALLSSCNDSFLQQDPIQELAEGSFLKNEGDLPLYLNQLYPIYIQGHQSGWAYDRIAPFYDVQGSHILNPDIFSDNAVRRGSASSRLNESYTVPGSGTNEGWSWGNLRTVNYFLRNYHAAESSVNDPSELNKWAAEAYFFKAWDYYRKVMIFGDVPWYVSDLNVDSPELFAPRTPRAEVMDSVLKCINFAVEHIADGGSSYGRINRDMANFLKARICLFEGTFRKYHTELGLQGTANKFLEECVTACEAIIATGRYQLYSAGSDPYYKMFTFKVTPDADGNKEAILARVYDGASDARGHCTQRYWDQNNSASGRFAIGATRGLVDEYLCADGRPIYIGGTEGNYTLNPLFKGYDGADWRELTDRDPRLKQTVAYPGEYRTITPTSTGEPNRDKYGIIYPRIGYNDGTSTVTGYLFVKHWMADIDEYNATTRGLQTALVFRYAEALLMLAEAKAELGTLNDNDLDRTINKLRERAGFDFSKYPGSRLTLGNIPADPRLDRIYAEKLDYALSPILREIRRERRVEMALEGLRYEDLMRWKAGKLLTVPLRGMKFTAEKQKLYDGSNEKPSTPINANSVTAVKAVINTDVFTDSEGFIIGYPRDARVNQGVLPWSDKRYYWPIAKDQLELNKNLTQTPGWEDIQR